MGQQMRASDADRDAAAAALHGRFAAGRLDGGELDERVATALEARTMGELSAVLADLPELQPDRAGLERRYRQLLACYPAAWRQGHGQEMVAVLMADAPAGRRRPAPADAASMIAGGLLVRCQRTRFGGEPAWRDALAVVTVLLPLVMLAIEAVQEPAFLHMGVFTGLFAHDSSLRLCTTLGNCIGVSLLAPLAVPLALAAVALLRLSRVAALSALAALIALGVLAGWSSLSLAFYSPWITTAVAVQVAAVAASPGPRRGLALLTWRGAALAVIAAAGIAVAGYPLSVIAVGVTAAAMALSSSLGRWLLLLLAIPLWPYLTSGFYPAIGSGGFRPRLYVSPVAHLNVVLGTAWSWQGAAYLIPVVLMCLFAVAARRDLRRTRRTAG